MIITQNQDCSYIRRRSCSSSSSSSSSSSRSRRRRSSSSSSNSSSGGGDGSGFNGDSGPVGICSFAFALSCDCTIRRYKHRI
jgi:hypothetical protein